MDIRESSDFVNRRRRHCTNCGRRFTTYERFEEAPLTVIKKNGDREQFDREKLLKGIYIACEKRPVPHEIIELMINEIEEELKQDCGTEIESRMIGEKVMQKLKGIDRVAYIRFASVYRCFKDIEEFENELKELKEGAEK